MSRSKRLEHGFGEGVEGLYRRYGAWLHGRLRRRIGAEAASDIVQETYTRLIRYDAHAIRHPKALLMQVARNLVTDAHRKSATMPECTLDDAAAPVAAADQVEALLLKQVILSMPPLYRDVFVLNRFGGMTYVQIAEKQGVSVKTIEWRMSRALEHCVSRLDGQAAP